MPRIISLLPLVLLLQSTPAIAIETESTDPIEQVVMTGWMKPYSDGNFHPEEIINRAQLASILVKAFELEKRIPQRQVDVAIRDVPASHWAYTDIQLVLRNNVMTGYREGRFFPNQRVARAEALSILAQAYGVFQFPEDRIEQLLSRYPDADKIPSWARKSMATALYEGFVNFDPRTNQINPLEPMTRGDMAYALSKYIERQEEPAPIPWEIEDYPTP